MVYVCNAEVALNGVFSVHVCHPLSPPSKLEAVSVLMAGNSKIFNDILIL